MKPDENKPHPDHPHGGPPGQEPPPPDDGIVPLEWEIVIDPKDQFEPPPPVD